MYFTKEMLESIDTTILDVEFSSEFQEKSHKCPLCGEIPENLSWKIIKTNEDKFGKREYYSGILTLCNNCNIQVDFFKNDELLKQSI